MTTSHGADVEFARQEEHAQEHGIEAPGVGPADARTAGVFARVQHLGVVRESKQVDGVALQQRLQQGGGGEGGDCPVNSHHTRLPHTRSPHTFV